MPTVILVEDDTSLRELTHEALECFGYDVVAFESADTAWGFLQQDLHCRPDLLVTDVRMPGALNGFGLARLVCTQMQLPAVICSGFCAEAVDEIAEVSVFLPKPWTMEDLQAACGEALDCTSRIRAT